MHDPSIEQIEREIRDARFNSADLKTEMMLSRRARNRMMQADISKSKDARVKRAYLAGYRIGSERRIFWGAALGVAIAVHTLGWHILIA
jgi:hypothetical protein